jgi:thymidylate kinase
MTIHTTPGSVAFSSPFETASPYLAARSDARMAPCVALIGCDGSGKSTLAHDIVALLDRQAPTRSMYLGLGTGDLGRRIGHIPVIGAVLERYLTGKANKAHAPREKRLPGLVTALAMYGFSLARMRRFRQMLAMREQGVRIITDRYPQAELAGGFDGPSLAWSRKGSPLVERLAAREHRLYKEMASYRPTLVIRLNVDVDTAFARKSDHPRELLEKKIAMVPTLRFGGAHIIDIDATRPYPEVLETVLALVQMEAIAA